MKKKHILSNYAEIINKEDKSTSECIDPTLITYVIETSDEDEFVLLED